MKIQNIETLQYKNNYSHHTNNIRFGNNINNDTFVPLISPEDAEDYDILIAIEQEKLNCILGEYDGYEQLLNHYKNLMSLLNRLDTTPKIDFKEAQSLDEAKKFALDSFNIHQFDVDDLPTANFINNALSHLYNLAQGHIYMPDKISVCPLEDEKTRGEYSEKSNLIRLNSSDFNPEAMYDSEKMYFRNDSLQYTEDYEIFYDSLSRVIFHELGHCNYYSNKHEKYGQKYIDKYSAKLKELDMEIQKHNSRLENLQKGKDALIEAQKTFLEKILDKIYPKPQSHEPQSFELLHFGIKPVLDKEDEIKNPLPWDEKEKLTALLISSYATTDREEFVADTFALMCVSNKLLIPSEAIKLYKESDGFMFL